MSNTIANALVRAFGAAGNGMPSGEDFYIPAATLAGGGTVRQILSGTSDVATTSDTWIAWYSASMGPKSQSVPAGTFNGQTFSIKDGEGNAATYNITITPVSGTIDNQSTYVMTLNFQSISLKWDGISNFIVV